VVEEEENKRGRERKKNWKQRKRRKEKKKRETRRNRTRKGRGGRGGEDKGRPGQPEDKEIQFMKCVLLCPVTKHYSITVITATHQLTPVFCQLLLTGKFTRAHTFSSLLVLGAPMQPELLHQKRSSILSGKKSKTYKT
jgi:hypothetical protein